jgi:SAM-dependent methyltransferase
MSSRWLGEEATRAARRRSAVGDRAQLRERGVVATPLAVARYGVARVDALLRSELGVSLESERVVVLDPAVGTGVWLAALLEHTRARGCRARLIGLDTDPHVIDQARLLLDPEAHAQGASLTLRCANTLELAGPFPDRNSVRVILGNPPWAARSLSRGGVLSDAWLAEFRREPDGSPLAERRLGVLSDDYVRFFRWALEHAREADAGALICLASNASFLDGPVHRGMRAALLRTFSRIEVLDLGGNSLLSRVGDRDDNVFGVRVGAALTWAVRARGPSVRPLAELAFASLRGSLSDKLQALERGAPMLAVHPVAAPYFRFRPASTVALPAGFSLHEAFPFHREGVQTNRDAVAIASSRQELEARALAIVRGELDLPAQRHFDPERARRSLAAALEQRGSLPLLALAYRPLDDRFLLALSPVCHRPRPELARALVHSRTSLLAVRKDRGGAAFNLFAPARALADACYLSTRSSCRTRMFPSHRPDGEENLAPAVADELGRRVGRKVHSEEVIAYALAVLGSPAYRALHQVALKLDYAHVPWPRDRAHFLQAVAIGRGFEAALHDPAPSFVGARADGAHDSLALAALAHCPRREQVSAAGRPVLHGVAASVYGATVGHHSFVSGALRPGAGTLLELERALARAQAWTALEARADACLGQAVEEGGQV